MQTTEDGEYIPEKELNKNFKIPKKPTSDVEESQKIDQQQEQQQTTVSPINGDQLSLPLPNEQFDNNSYFNYQSTVLDNSYYNYPMLQPTYFNIENYAKYCQNQPPKPRTNKPAKLLRETIPDLDDETLPKELTSMFQPLYCKLCSARLSSNIVAKLHYKSKSHEKKVRKFLTEHSQKTGEPLHKRARMSNKEEEDNPLYFHCDVCDLPLTGKLHAESHYAGKNHRKAILGQKTPAGKGFYDDEGKWVRQSSSKKTKNPITFGAAFRAVEKVEEKKESIFQCDLCNIKTTCRDQLESHFNGQKHQKKLKQQQKYAQQLMGSATATEKVMPTDNILTSVLVNSEQKLDLSVYRTPSGQYYCQNCNLSLNSETQFRQHLQSKRHLQKIKLN